MFMFNVCIYEPIAGFFDAENVCVGNLVSGGEIVQISSTHNVNFGIRNGLQYVYNTTCTIT